MANTTTIPKGNEENQGEEKEVNHGNTKLPYGLAAREGIGTTGLTPRQVWDKLKGRGVFPPWENGGKKDEEKTKESEPSSNWEEVQPEENFFGESNKEYIEVKTRKEAESFARETLGITHANYGSMGVDVANDLNKSLSYTLQEFPEVIEVLGATGELQSTAQALKKRIKDLAEKDAREYYAFLKEANPNLYELKVQERIKKVVTQKTKSFKSKPGLMGVSIKYRDIPLDKFHTIGKEYRGIFVDKKYAKNTPDVLQTLRKDVEHQFHPVGEDSIKSIVDHELGHAIDNKYNISSSQAFNELYSSTKDIKSELSGYAMTNRQEFFAEAWSEFQNNPNPRPVAMEVGKIVKEEYNKWKMMKK